VQFDVVPSCTLQPSAAVPHAAQPDVHVGAHAPFVHAVAVVCALVPQVTPQPPQLVLSVPTGSSQPLAGMPSQSAYRGEQVGWHVLLEQVLAVTWAAVAVLHTLPQPLQLLASVAPLVAQPFCGLPHIKYVPVHTGTQVPALQLVLLAFVVEQAVAHPPQWFLSVSRFDSQPLDATVSQLP
jgi:hypothetical protein